MNETISLIPVEKGDEIHKNIAKTLQKYWKITASFPMTTENNEVNIILCGKQREIAKKFSQ